MNAQKILTDINNLRLQALIAAAETKEQSQRIVLAEVFYHMPDQPHVINSMPWQFDDRFDAGDRIIEDLTSSAGLFTADESDKDSIDKAFENAVTFYQSAVMDAWHHLDRISSTEEHFEIPFSEHGSNFHTQLIDDVPFPRLRKFLNYWRENIDGVLNTVAVTHLEPARMQVTQFDCGNRNARLII